MKCSALYYVTGQKIRQTMAADHRGYAFGEIKAGMFSSAKSGFYPAELVAVDKKHYRKMAKTFGHTLEESD